MNKTKIKTMLMFALAILGGSVWAEVPQPVYTWDGADGTATEETVFGKTVYTVSNGKVINATDTIQNGIPAKNFTFSMWTKKRSNPNWRDVCGFADSSYQFKLEENTDGGLYVYGTQGAGLYAEDNPRFISSADYSAQEFQLLTVVQNNGIVYGYINGVLKMTSLESTAWEALKSDTAKMTYFAWGCSPNTNGTADRSASLSVADVSIYDVALTDEQVMELYYSYLGVATIPTMTIGGEGNSEVNWSTVEKWADGNVAVSGPAKIILQGDATLSIDRDIDLYYISVEGDYTLTVKRTLETGTTRISNLVADKDIVMATDDIQVEYFGCPVTYTGNVKRPRSSISGITYAAGAGASDSHAELSLVGGSATLTGSDPFYLVESYSATATDVTFDGANVVYGGTYQDGTTRSNFSLGMATYIIKGDSNVSAERMVLSQGADGQTSVITIQDDSVVNITGNNNVDQNTASIMFGHWNGPSTFTIKDEAQFNAQSQVLVGKTGNNQTININGGTFTAKGIKASASAGGTNVLNINGGTLKLGETGITSYGSTSISVNVGGNATFEATAETLPVSQSVNLAQDVLLTIKGYVKFTGVVSGAGSFIADGEGVVLDFGNANIEAFTGSYSVQNGATLILPAGAENGVSVPEGCTLKLSLSQEQLAKGYSSEANSPVSFVTREGDAVTDNVNGGVYYAPFPVWTPVSADSSWSNSALWSSGSVPTTGDIVIDTSAMTEPISVQVPSGFASVIILGNDSILTSISFNGVPSSISVFGKVKIPVETINAVESLDIKENVTLAVDVAEGEVAVAKEIRGNFAFVKTGAGTLKLDAEIVPNGGTVIEEGTLKFGTHYLGDGSYNNAGDVRVKSGAVFDYNGKPDAFIRNVTLEEGAVFQNSSDNDIGTGKRQLKGIILEGDATVYANGDFGLVASGHNPTKLQLNNHCLTKTGPGNFWLINTTDNNNAGDFRVKEGILCCSTTASTLTGVKLSIEGEAKLKLDARLSGLASLKFRSNGSGDGVGFAGLANLDAAIRPVIDAGLINPESLNVGDTVTLVTGSGLTNNFAEVSVGGRFNEESIEITDAAVTATVGELKNFWHYDFNDGVMTKEAAKAEDSTYELGNWGDVNGDDKSIATRNGKAALLYRISNSQRFSVYWNNNTADKIPFYAGVMTAVSIIKPKATDKRIIWALGSGGNSGAFVALTVDNDNTISMISWANNTLTTLASVSGIKNLTKTFHFVAVEFTPEGTTLWVDDKKVTTDKIFPEGVGKVGQLASVHGNVPGDCGYTRLESGGCYLDDWTVYDSVLTQNELKALRSRLTPRPFFIRVR